MTVKILGLVFGVFATFACAGGSGTGAPTSSIRPADEKKTVSVEIQNDNFYQVTVYAYRPGSRKQLGVIESRETRSFEFVWITGEVRFLINFFNNGCILTWPLAVDRGDDLMMIIEPQDHVRASDTVCRV